MFGRFWMSQLDPDRAGLPSDLFWVTARFRTVGVFLAIVIGNDELAVFDGLFQKLVEQPHMQNFPQFQSA